MKKLQFSDSGVKKLKLVQVDRNFKEIIQDYKYEYMMSHNRINGGCGLHHYNNIDDWFDELDKIIAGTSNRRVQSYTYICMVDEKMVGILDIRLKLPNEWYSAGHIGYSIRPSERKKGYATKALKEALIIANKLGIKPVIITCLKSNDASRNVILNNGGIFIEEIIEDGEKNLVFKFN